VAASSAAAAAGASQQHVANTQEARAVLVVTGLQVWLLRVDVDGTTMLLHLAMHTMHVQHGDHNSYCVSTAPYPFSHILLCYDLQG
jgi:hypothetical protein